MPPSLGQARPDPFECLFGPVGTLVFMQDPPAVRLPGHFARAGSLLAWRLMPDGSWEALVEYVEDVPGYRGSLEPRQSWFRADQVEPIKGEDYSRVPRTKAEPGQP